ncbi:MAG: hypothetical protein J6I50_06730 [Clostridia bacterium]|nr:hypothetical protein [Clostridia bacterium]
MVIKMKKQRRSYADTIRKKMEKETEMKTVPKKPALHLNRFNQLFWPLILFPIFTLLYIPINRYIMLPKLGSGRPYVNLSGQLVEQYFSANTAAHILFLVLLLITEFLLFRTLRVIHGWKKALLCIAVTVLNVAAGLLFLEFTLWS